jgi:hypothetical protein
LKRLDPDLVAFQEVKKTAKQLTSTSLSVLRAQAVRVDRIEAAFGGEADDIYPG